jgi:hypothetical protein
MQKFLFSILSTLLLIATVSSYSQVSPISNKQFSELKFDTSQTAIIELKRPLNWIFDSTYKPSELIQSELSIIDSLLIIAVDDFNSFPYRLVSSPTET